jgi:hypothetical protein
VFGPLPHYLLPVRNLFISLQYHKSQVLHDAPMLAVETTTNRITGHHSDLSHLFLGEFPAKRRPARWVYYRVDGVDLEKVIQVLGLLYCCACLYRRSLQVFEAGGLSGFKFSYREALMEDWQGECLITSESSTLSN